MTYPANLRTLILCLLPATLCAQIKSTPATSAPVMQQETQLPPFTLWTADGLNVDSTHFAPGGFWLLFYRDLASPQADTLTSLLESLATDTKSKLDPARLVIVVTHATGAQVSALALAHPALASATWLRDEKDVAAITLNLHGSPHLIGMHNSARRWQLAGSLESPATQSAILSWLANNTLPANKLTMQKVKLAPPIGHTLTPSAQGAAK